MDHRNDAADLLVIFSITGDLARKMTFRALYRLEQRGLLDFPVIGVASDAITTTELVKHAREAIADSGQEVGDAVFDRLASRMSYLYGEVTDAALYRALARKVDRSRRPCATWRCPRPCSPPSSSNSARRSSCATAGVAVEKPFGHDLASACELNARLHRLLRESQILRVDHFLGKEPVVELEYLRFANVALATCGTARACPACRSRWPKISASRAAAGSTTPSARCATWSRTTCCRCWPWSPWTRRSALAPATRRTRRRRCSAPCRRPTLSTACEASTRGMPMSPAWQRLGHRDLRGAAAGDRQLALG
jgi:hypothetical protein